MIQSISCINKQTQIKFKSKFNISAHNLLVLFPLLILVGKFLRYTVMKESLVDAGIGHGFINAINYGYLNFGMFNGMSANSIYIYSLFNIFHLNTYSQFEIAISIIFNFIVFINFLKIRDNLNVFDFVFLCLLVIVLNIFDFCLSKEPIQMIAFLLIGISIRFINNKFWKILVTAFIIILSYLYLREYYILILPFSLYSYLALKFYIKRYSKNSIIKKIFFWLMLVLTLYVFHLIMMLIINELDGSIYNELLRARSDRNEEANSAINNIITNSQSNIVLFSLEYIFSVIRLLFPVELLKSGFKTIPYVLFRAFISYYLIKNISNYKKITIVQKIGLIIYLGFVLTSATFEPDFGSWVRHEMVSFPLILIFNGIYDLNLKFYQHTNFKNVREIV